MIAEEIRNLKKEAKALKTIRESMGSTGFSQKVFDKVFKEDIERLRGMEEMWNSRKMPEILSYDALSLESAALVPSISLKDQTPWSAAENFAVFQDR